MFKLPLPDASLCVTTPYLEASAPPDEPPGYASACLDAVLAEARAARLDEDAIVRRLTDWQRPGSPAMIVQWMQDGDSAAAGHWYRTLSALRECRAIGDGSFMRLLAGRGAESGRSSTKRGLFHVLASTATPSLVDMHMNACMDAQREKHWLNESDMATVLIGSPQCGTLLQDVIRGRCSADSFDAFLTKMRHCNNWTFGLRSEHVATLMLGKGPRGTTLDAAFDHPEAELLGAYMSHLLALHGHHLKRCRDQRVYSNGLLDIDESQYLSLALPSDTASNAPLREAFRSGKGAHLSLYFKRLFDAAKHHELPVDGLREAFSRCLPRGWSMGELAQRQPDCHALLIKCIDRALLQGWLSHREATDLTTTGRAAPMQTRSSWDRVPPSPAVPKEGATATAAAPARQTAHSRQARRSNLLNCFVGRRA